VTRFSALALWTGMDQLGGLIVFVLGAPLLVGAFTAYLGGALPSGCRPEILGLIGRIVNLGAKG